MNTITKKIAVLIESDFYEKEISHYQTVFPQAGFALHFLSRLWGKDRQVFTGHEDKTIFECSESFENMGEAALKNFSAIIVPSGYVADRLRYTEDAHKLPPACEFLKRAFAHKNILKGIICHGMWLMAPIVELVKDRKAVVHNNLLGDAKCYGIKYVDQDIVVDKDLVTARTGGHCELFAQAIIDILSRGKKEDL